MSEFRDVATFRLTKNRINAMRSLVLISFAMLMSLLVSACGGEDAPLTSGASTKGGLAIEAAPSPAPSLKSAQAASSNTGQCASLFIPISQVEGFCQSDGTAVDAVSIQASRTSCIAPCGVFFETQMLDDLGVDRPIHELSYQWTFNDPDASFEAIGEDFPESFKDANVAQGPMTAHVFEKPGTYEVEVFVTNKDNLYATAKQTIEVRNPDNRFTGSRTICYSKAEDFSGCPSGAQRFSDLETAFGAVQENRTRVLLRSGEETLFDFRPQFRGLRDIHVGSFGPGAKPVLRFDTISSIGFAPRDTNGLTIYGLELRGDYDPTTGMGENHDDVGIGNVAELTNLTVFRNTFRGLSAAVKFSSNPLAVVVADNIISDWYDYGVYDRAPNRTAYIGNSIKQNPDAISGTGAKDRNVIPRWSDHGPIRTAEVTSLVIAQNDMFSNAGWSSGGQAHQPTIRYNSSGKEGHFGIINRNRLEGGFQVASLTTQNGSTTTNAGDVIFERNMVLGTDNTVTMIMLGYGGTTIRNNLAIMPDAVSTFNPFRAFVERSSNSSSEANDRLPIHVDHNTIVHLQKRTSQAFSALLGYDPVSFQDVRASNNIVSALRIPNRRDFVDYRPLDERDFYRPEVQSRAVGAADPNTFVRDTLDGKVRSQTPSVGALEPNF
ncbi:MAG: PKD domain-containing protein [Pseudomonadota bacterium]